MYTEGRLIVEFTFDDMMRIRAWHFAVRYHRELIPRSILAMQEPGMIESLSKNITRQGLTNTTLNYLRVSLIKSIILGAMLYTTQKKRIKKVKLSKNVGPQSLKSGPKRSRNPNY